MGMIFLHNLNIDEVIFVSKTLQNGFSFLLSNSKFFTSKGPVILNLVKWCEGTLRKKNVQKKRSVLH